MLEAGNLEDDFEEVFQHFESFEYDLFPQVHIPHLQHDMMLVMLLLVGLKFSDDKA